MDNQQHDQPYTQEDYDEAQRQLLDWMLPIIQREATNQRQQQDEHQKAA